MTFRSGFVAIVGRANVGKSSLLNALVGHKLSIVSAKPHTTRHKLLGVLHGEGFQAALLDTPGFLRKGRDELDAAMARQVASAFAEADLAVLVAEPRMPGDVERQFMEQLRESRAPALLALNKVDTTAKARLLPIMAAYTEAHPFRQIVPLSALTGDGVGTLADELAAALPEQEPLFAPETLTDRPEEFFIAEAIRERVFEHYRDEIPYYVAVDVEEYVRRGADERDLVRAVIYVDAQSQKRMLIGSGGQALRTVGVEARAAIEERLARPVYVELWVKVAPKWRRKAGFVAPRTS